MADVSVVNTGAESAQANWKLTTPDITTTLDIYVTPGPITATQEITDANGNLKTIEVPLCSGFPLTRSVATARDGSLSTTNLDLRRLPSGTYWVWFDADDGRNPPTRAYAPLPIIVSHPWQNTWTAELATTPGYRDLAVSWRKHPNPDVNNYKLTVGTQPML